MCTRARESDSCQNRRFIYPDVVEEAVIAGLIDQLMHRNIIAKAVQEYYLEMGGLVGERCEAEAAGNGSWRN
jgi:hypothetical protein